VQDAKLLASANVFKSDIRIVGLDIDLVCSLEFIEELSIQFVFDPINGEPCCLRPRETKLKRGLRQWPSTALSQGARDHHEANTAVEPSRAEPGDPRLLHYGRV
jgi:hypothetical protein